MTRVRTFRDYVSASGRNEIRAWLDGLTPKAKLTINNRLRNLEVLAQLRDPDSKLLHGECGGLMELRIKADKVQYRPLCCYGPGDKEITILMGAHEKSGKLQPASACETAQRRKQEIGEKGRTCDHDFQ